MMQLRPARPEDQTSIMALIDAVYHEYGDRLCLDNADRDLLDIDAALCQRGGSLLSALATSSSIKHCEGSPLFLVMPSSDIEEVKISVVKTEAVAVFVIDGVDKRGDGNLILRDSFS